ncbi:MAG: PAS domain-containing protein [Pseudomonadota bacterium]
MKQLSRRVLKDLFNSYPQGVALVEAKDPHVIVSANAALELISGFCRPEIIGQGLFFFADGLDSDYAHAQLAQVMDGTESLIVPMVGQREDGDLVAIDIRLEAIKDARNRVTHIAAFYEQRMEPDDRSIGGGVTETFIPKDKVTGVYSQQYFEESFQRHWRLARREKQSISLLAFEPDFFGEFMEKFGVAAVNSCLKKVAGIINAGFRRPADTVARLDHSRFLVAALNVDDQQVRQHAEDITQRVRDHCIHHPSSPISKYLTLSVGVASCCPGQDQSPDELVSAALDALAQAHDAGSDRVILAA